MFYRHDLPTWLYNLASPVGAAPTTSGFSDRRSTDELRRNKRTPVLLAGANRIGRLLLGLESNVLPLHQAPVSGVIKIVLLVATPKFHGFNYTVARRGVKSWNGCSSVMSSIATRFLDATHTGMFSPSSSIRCSGARVVRPLQVTLKKRTTLQPSGNSVGVTVVVVSGVEHKGMTVMPLV